jgi:uncharacterized protein YecE (DUF72 family)
MLPMLKDRLSRKSIKSQKSIQIGTCSWKYDSWKGLVYSKEKPISYLQEYSRRYSTVEVDQWFWSLFKGNAVVLPKPDVVREYAASVPPGFVFSIKVPNSITLTHHYAKQKKSPLAPNPYFLSTELMEKFIETIEPLGDHIGPLLFQFEYLNKNKMSGLSHFIEMFEIFKKGIPEGYQYCIEIRNPNFLKDEYFDFLSDLRLGHVFLQGYFMPSIFEVYEKFKVKLHDPVVIRLHGPDRKDIEERTKNSWNEIVEPKDEDLMNLKSMVRDLQERQHQIFINVNNHFEGCAPKTIEKIKSLLQRP